VSDDPSRVDNTYYDDETSGANYYGQGKSLGQPTNSKSGESKARKGAGRQQNYVQQINERKHFKKNSMPLEEFKVVMDN
jgi:hypothetical protein